MRCLQDKGLKEGTLYARIDQAAKEHLVTLEMASWAHQVRLDANDERHPGRGCGASYGRGRRPER